MQTATQVHNIGVVNQMTPAQKDELLLKIVDTLSNAEQWSDELEEIQLQVHQFGFKVDIAKDF